jgi:hypothetical protein
MIGRAILSSDEIVPADVQCLTFWYYVKLYYTTALRVYTNNTWQSTINTLLTLSEIQPNSWIKVQLELNETSMFNIVFEVTKSKNYGEMALDDISIINTPCNGKYELYILVINVIFKNSYFNRLFSKSVYVCSTPLTKDS